MTENTPLVVTVERRDGTGIVTLNRPDVINAFNDAVRQSVPEIFRSLDEDREISAIVLTGAGERGFCVGADIKEKREGISAVAQRKRLMPTSWIEALDRIAKPIIAAIHGYCLGGGLELALACDIRVASKDAQFGFPETALGLIPGGGGTQRLPRIIGLARALDMLITGDRIGADEAYRIGLITRLAETREACLVAALRLAEQIAGQPPTAIAYVKEAAHASLQLDLANGLALEKSLFALLTATSDRAEAAAAFREKRPPKFVDE
jgi:enoyl-CoA hydratase/carnithine racemase